MVTWGHMSMNPKAYTAPTRVFSTKEYQLLWDLYTCTPPGEAGSGKMVGAAHPRALDDFTHHATIESRADLLGLQIDEPAGKRFVV